MTTPVTGDPDHIWIHRKGKKQACLFEISRLQAIEFLVCDFRDHLQKSIPSYRNVDSNNIYIRKYGETEFLRSSIPITELGGNTDDTPHHVEVYTPPPEVR